MILGRMYHNGTKTALVYESCTGDLRNVYTSNRSEIE